MKSSALLLVAWALGLGACAGHDEATREEAAAAEPAPATYDEVVRARLDAARGTRVYALRYNPNSCGCPPFEILLGETWQRVTLELADDDPVLRALEAALDGDDGRQANRTYVLEGSLDGALAVCGRGAIVVTLEPTGLAPPSPPPGTRLLR